MFLSLCLHCIYCEKMKPKVQKLWVETISDMQKSGFIYSSSTPGSGNAFFRRVIKCDPQTSAQLSDKFLLDKTFLSKMQKRDSPWWMVKSSSHRRCSEELLWTWYSQKWEQLDYRFPPHQSCKVFNSIHLVRDAFAFFSREFQSTGSHRLIY